MQNLPKTTLLFRGTPSRSRPKLCFSVSFLLVMMLCTAPPSASGQTSFGITTVTYSEPVAREDLVVRAELNEPGSHERIYLRYRPFGSTE